MHMHTGIVETLQNPQCIYVLRCGSSCLVSNYGSMELLTGLLILKQTHGVLWRAAAGGGASGGIFTVELAANGSANIVGVFPTTVVSSGAADITAAPDGKVYVVKSPNLVGTAYEVSQMSCSFLTQV